MEIGCRWGGMFILITEWLRNSGADLKTVIALDPIAPTPFISAYFDLLRQQAAIEPTCRIFQPRRWSVRMSTG